MIKKIKSIISYHLEEGVELDIDTPLSQYDIDDLDIMEIALALEDYYGIEIPDDDIPTLCGPFPTINDIENYIRRKKKEL